MICSRLPVSAQSGTCLASAASFGSSGTGALGAADCALAVRAAMITARSTPQRTLSFEIMRRILLLYGTGSLRLSLLWFRVRDLGVLVLIDRLLVARIPVLEMALLTCLIEIAARLEQGVHILLLHH